MTDETIRAKLSGIRCFLLDMDGTFYLGDRIIPGGLEFLDALEKTGRTARFLTNNSSRSASTYAEKLARMGVPAAYRDVITSGQAAARYCLTHFPGKTGYLLGNPVLRAELTAMGLRFCDSDDADYVLAAFDTTLDYGKLCRVCDLIRTGKPYIATHPDFNCPTEHGFIPDLGAFMALIHASTGRWADVVIGKPNRGIVDEALARTGFALHEMAMVGDRLYTDVATGVNHGMTGILVLSGEAKRSDVDTSDVKPDLIFGRLSDIIPYLLAQELSVVGIVIAVYAAVARRVHARCAIEGIDDKARIVGQNSRTGKLPGGTRLDTCILKEGGTRFIGVGLQACIFEALVFPSVEIEGRFNFLDFMGIVGGDHNGFSHKALPFCFDGYRTICSTWPSGIRRTRSPNELNSSRFSDEVAKRRTATLPG